MQGSQTLLSSNRRLLVLVVLAMSLVGLTHGLTFTGLPFTFSGGDVTAFGEHPTFQWLHFYGVFSGGVGQLWAVDLRPATPTPVMILTGTTLGAGIPSFTGRKITKIEFSPTTNDDTSGASGILRLVPNTSSLASSTYSAIITRTSTEEITNFKYDDVGKRIWAIEEPSLTLFSIDAYQPSIFSSLPLNPSPILLPSVAAIDIDTRRNRLLIVSADGQLLSTSLGNTLLVPSFFTSTVLYPAIQTMTYHPLGYILISFIDGSLFYVGVHDPITLFQINQFRTTGRVVTIGYDPNKSTFLVFQVPNSGNVAVSRYDITGSVVDLKSSARLPAIVQMTSSSFSNYYGSYVAVNSRTNNYVIKPANCSVSCSKCRSDPTYCSFCLEYGECRPQADCLSTLGCPLVNSFDPPSFSPAQPSNLTVLGNIFQTGSLHQCYFEAATDSNQKALTPARVLNSNTLTCPTPTGWDAGTYPNIKASVYYNGTLFPETRSFDLSFVDCSTLDASACGVDNNCAWCVSTSSCSATSQCSPSDSLYKTVPDITSVQPLIAARYGGESIRVQLNVALPTTAIVRCVWGTLASPQLISTSASISSSRTTVTCNTASVPSWSTTTATLLDNAIEKTFNFSIRITTSNNVVATTTRRSFIFYDCSAAHSCRGSCIDPLRHPQCGWCSAQRTCGYLASYSSGPASAACPNPELSASSCILLNRGVNSSMFYDGTPANLVSEISASVAPGTQLNGASCGLYHTTSIPEPPLSGPGSTAWASALSISPAATGTLSIDETELTCQFPTQPIGRYILALYLPQNGRVITNGVLVEVYTCESVTQCDSCLSSTRPKCGWCATTSTCGLVSALTSSCANSYLETSNQCPRIIRAPVAFGSSTLASDFAELVLETAILPLQANLAPFNFVIKSGATTIFTGVASPSQQQTSCNVTSVNITPGEYQLSITRNGNPWANPVPIRVSPNCATATSCSQCTSSAFSGCAWCSNELEGTPSCKPIQRCSDNLVTPDTTPSCGVSLSPDGVEVTNPFPTRLFITAGPFPLFLGATPLTYSCSFDSPEGSFSVPAQVDVQNVRWICIAPVRPVSGDITLSFSLQSPTEPGKQFTLVSRPLTYYSCADTFGAQSCGEALCTPFQQRCGWCSNTLQCTSQSRCSSGVGGVGNIVGWLESCIVVTPSQNYLSLSGVGGNTRITIDLSAPLPDSIPRGNSTSISKKDVFDQFALTESFETSALSCKYGDIGMSPATISADGLSVACDIAPSSSVQSTTMSLVFEPSPTVFRAISNPISFFYASCSGYTTCEECAAESACGWCLNENRCSTRDTCPASSGFALNDCPSVSSLNPTGGSSGTQVRLQGKYLTRDTRVKVGNKIVVPTVLDGSTLTFIAPSNSGGPTAVTLVTTSGARYSSNSASFLYSGLSKGAKIGIGVGVSLGLLALLAILIFAILWALRKSKKAGGPIVKLVPPNYPAIAFMSDMQPKYKAPHELDEALDKLEQLLARPDHAYQIAIEAVSGASDLDEVAKCFVRLGHRGNYAVKVINAIVAAEIQRCEFENTIFRGNSLASKMFTVYSRIVAVKYIWNCLAQLIGEIHAIASQELKARQKGNDRLTDEEEGGMTASLLRMDFEVDPEKQEELGGDFDVDVNSIQLSLACQKIFSNISKSVGRIPKPFKDIFLSIDQEVRNKFGSNDAVSKAVGGFFFLRFVCPAITAPHVYGLLTEPPNDLSQRQLVLISKVLQSLANLTIPGEKEEYMQKLTGWVEQNIPAMQALLDKLHAPGASNTADESTPVTDIVRTNALCWLWLHLKNKNVNTKLVAKLQEHPQGQALVKELEECLAMCDEPPAKVAAKAKSKKVK